VGRTRGAWPARGKGYLTADPTRAKEFGERLKPFGERPRVGVIWHSQFFDGKRANAYAPTEMYGPLLRNFGDVTLVSLQYSHASEGIARLREISGVEVHDFPDLDQFMDVDGVAALIANLDFVVGAKTAPVMLAAALGIPALAIVGGTPWAKPAADGHDPWLPALREVAGGLDWLGLFAKTERISLEWLDALAAGKSLVHPRPAFS
jgi:capsular polysaccharide export protein